MKLSKNKLQKTNSKKQTPKNKLQKTNSKKQTPKNKLQKINTNKHNLAFLIRAGVKNCF